ncbi:MAG: carboxypeptidase-like regulatory domain-containing protein [Bacteroidota bacterium]
MKVKTIKSKLLAVGLALVIYSCNAPHSNPLDPENPDNNFAVLSGTVETETLPREPIEGASIFWMNDNILIKTNQDGKFKIDNLSRKSGWLQVTKMGFSNDSTFITWNEQKVISVNRYLNSIPQIENLKLYTIVLNKFPQNQTFKLTIEADISDREEDVDSVFVENESVDIFYPLSEIRKNHFERTFVEIDLNILSFDEVIGKEFNIVVKDKFHNQFVIGGTNVKRIIKQEVETISPKNYQDSVSQTPELKWKRFQPGFKFDYFAEIYTDEVQPIKVWESGLISSDSISVKVDQAITGNIFGEYFWVIWAADEFENKTRSKPATFIVR